MTPISISFDAGYCIQGMKITEHYKIPETGQVYSEYERQKQCVYLPFSHLSPLDIGLGATWTLELSYITFHVK